MPDLFITTPPTKKTKEPKIQTLRVLDKNIPTFILEPEQTNLLG